MTAPADKPDSPGVLIFPPLLFAIGIVAGVLLGLIWPHRILSTLLARTVGVVVFALGMLLARLAQTAMTRAGTNVRPDKPSLFLVTNGPFALSRNPLYLATLLLYLGIAIFANSLAALLSIIPVIVILEWGVVRREERYLEAKFGEPYRSYRQQVRRWV